MSESASLTVFQTRFVQEYLADPRSATAVYRKIDPLCTYETARREASTLLADPRIKIEIRAGLASLEKASRVTAKRVRKALAQVAFADPVDMFDVDDDDNLVLRPVHKMPARIRKAIGGVKVKRVEKKVKRDDDKGTTTTVTVDVIEVKLNSRVSAQDKLAKILGMYEKHQLQKTKSREEYEELCRHRGLDLAKLRGGVNAVPLPGKN